MDPSTIADDLNEVSVLISVAHRLLLSIRDDVETSSAFQGMVEDLNAVHDDLDSALERLGSAIDMADAEANRQPREPRPTIH
jgi:hypothetical protein